jgi:xylulose-5-phosphate/fructose-6-phosphate phosphoketolase
MERCLTSTNSINLVVATKQPLPQWLTIDEARRHCAAGASTWEWASTAGSDEPDIVFAAAGAIPTIETLAAVRLLRNDLPELKTRVVNIVDLLALEPPDEHPHGLSAEEFTHLFTDDRPVVFFFHGYPTAIHELVHHRPNPSRFHVGGYIEEGTTEPPFQLLIDNGVSRYDLAIRALQRSVSHASLGGRLIEEYTRQIHRASDYIREHGTDPPEISEWRWSDGLS